MKWAPLFLLLLGVDFASKVWAAGAVPMVVMGSYPFGGVGIFDWAGITFSLNFITNTGAAWGLFAGHAGLLFLARCAVISVLVFYGRKKWPVWLVATGAVGNVIDYCLYGYVIDFLHFTFWGYEFPIFNVADSCITVGVALLLVSKREAVPA